MSSTVVQSFLFFLLVAPLSSCRQLALNIPQVLLPYVPDRSGVRTNFSLMSEDGCFTWDSTKPDVAMVTPFYETSSQECSRQAIVTSVWGEPWREKAVILAEEQSNDTVIPCDVLVDTIQRIEIVTRTRELEEEVPEMFHVRAFDEEGNTFSTLRGLLFEWTLLKDPTTLNQKFEPEDILRFIPYSFDPVIEEIEQQGFRGDSVLVQGINMGSVVIRAKLQNRAWQNVPPDSVRLIVKENMMFMPNLPVFIIPLTYMDYTVWRKKQAVPLPSTQYSAQLSNTSVCQLVVEKTRVIGQDYGHTRLLLTDINNPSDRSVSTEISVMQPHHLGFHVTGGLWVLEVGRLYAITVQLFDLRNHSLFMSENLRLDTAIPRDFFDIIDMSLNGSYFYIRPKKSGHPSFSSSFNKLVHPDNGSIVTLSSTLTQQQPLVIYGPVVVEVNPVVILWYAAVAEGESTAGRETYSYQLQVFGGSGSYLWSVDDNNGVIAVSSKGMVTALVRGSSSVKVTDQKNALHFDIVKVHVVQPRRIQFLYSKVEAEVGSSLSLPIQISAYVDESQPLSPVVDCRRLSLNIHTTSQTITNSTMDAEVELSSLPKGACGAISVVVARVGNAKVTIMLEAQTFGRLEATTTIVAYPYTSNPCVACLPDVIGQSKIALLLPVLVLVLVSLTVFSLLLAIQSMLSALKQPTATNYTHLTVNVGLFWDTLNILDEILHWLATREGQYGTWLATTPTQDLHTGTQCLDEMQRLAQDLSEKAKEKDTALAEAQYVLQQAGPKTRREISKRVDTIVSSWARIEEDCKRVMTVLQEYLPKLEKLWRNIEHCKRPLDDADRKSSAAMQCDQVDSAILEQHEVIMKIIAHALSDVSPLVETIRPQWERLTDSHPSLKEVVPSILDPLAFDAEGRITAMEERLKLLQSLQKFLKDLESLLEWFQWARDASIPEARADFSLTSLMEQLQELNKFQQTLAVKQGEIPPLLERAQLLSQADMILPLHRLLTEVEDKCKNRKQFLKDLTGRWRAFLDKARALMDETNEMGEKLSDVIANKNKFGVEDHLATCKDFNKSFTKKVFEFGQFQGVAASFEIEVRGQGWDSGVVTAKNAEVKQSRVSLSDFIDETQAKLQAVADRLKELHCSIKEKQAWLEDVYRRSSKWRPCLGDVTIVRFELYTAECLLAEAHTHDGTIKQLTDNVDFVVQHSRQSERKRAKDAIQDIRQHHADLKQQLQDKVSQCQAALPLWQSFAATTTELASWMNEKEKLVSSLPMRPSLNSDEENEMAVRIMSVQSELVHGNSRLQQLQSLEADLTKACDMEKDKIYITEKCAGLEAQYKQLVKMAEAALALCMLCKSVRTLRHCIQQHRSLPSPLALPGPELEKMHNGLLAESMSLEQQTQTALKDLMIAVQDAEKCGASILPEIQQAVDDVTADAKQFPADARSWRQGLTSRYNAWTRFRKGLEQYIQSVTDLRTRVGTEIDAQPFWVFLKDLDVFKKVLKSMVSVAQAAKCSLPYLEKTAKDFLIGDSQPVTDLRDAFTLAVQQHRDIAAHLQVYLNRVASWEEYFDLMNAALVGSGDPLARLHLS